MNVCLKTTNKVKEYTHRIVERLNKIKHVKERDMTYISHMKEAVCIGTYMFLGSMALFVHSVFPNIFTQRGSITIKHLYDKLIKDKPKEVQLLSRDKNSQRLNFTIN
jgi:hypothetical protein